MVKTANTIYRDNLDPHLVSIGGTYVINEDGYSDDLDHLRVYGTVEWSRISGEEVTAIHSRDLFFWDEEGG